jgi:hypothetical protein
MDDYTCTYEALIDMPDGGCRLVEVEAMNEVQAYRLASELMHPGEVMRGVTHILTMSGLPGNGS